MPFEDAARMRRRKDTQRRRGHRRSPSKIGFVFEYYYLILYKNEYK
jgi:hypothetical protein